MIDTPNLNFQLFDDPLKLYNSMLLDIKKAQKYIYIETYRWANDNVGLKFRDALIAKAVEGLEIKILVDSWATTLPNTFFANIINAGGEVRFFKKIKFSFDFFTKNHRRNHRKLLLIDNNISYMGSANFTAYSLNWRELVIRLNDGITEKFKRSFLESYKIYNKYIFNKFSFKKTIKHNGFEIIQDLPSIYRQQIKKKFELLIQNAKKEVTIETPYFLPGYKLRKSLIEAAQRGVVVNIIVPEHSDVKIVDILRSLYLGLLYEHGVSIYLYFPYNLHAKCLLVDNEIFEIGSPNFDYRSFRYMYEIALVGKEPAIISKLNEHIRGTMIHCKHFNYTAWQNRPLIEKIFARLLIPLRHLF